MAFTPAQLWEFSERLLARQQRLYLKWVHEGRIKLDHAEMENEMLLAITKILQDRAQRKLDL